MTDIAPTPRPSSPIRLVKSHRTRPARLVGGRDGAVAGATPSRAVTANLVWARTLRRFGRAAIWTLPAYAVVLAVIGLADVPDPDANFGAYAGYVTADSFRFLTMGTVAAFWLGLLGFIALTGLLAGTRGRRTAIAGLLAGLSGTVLALPLIGLHGLAEPVIGRVYQRGDRAGALALNADLYNATTDWITLASAVLGALGWLLLGLATLRAKHLNRADGYLLGLAGLVLGAGSYVPLLRTIGALLFLAAALGLAFTANRLIPRSAAQ